MLNIRKEQFEVFSSEQEKRFLQELEKHVREQFPEECSEFDDKALVQLVHTSKLKAQQYGIEQRRDFFQYLNYVMLFGEKFDQEQEWAKLILSDSSEPSGAVKLLRLNELALDED